MSITASNSNTFFMPNTRSTLSCISDTSMNTSNLSMYINYYRNHKHVLLHIAHHLPELLVLLRQTLANHEVIYTICKRILTYMTYLAPVSISILHSVWSNNLPCVYPCPEIGNFSSA